MTPPPPDEKIIPPVLTPARPTQPLDVQDVPKPLPQSLQIQPSNAARPMQFTISRKGLGPAINAKSQDLGTNGLKLVGEGSVEVASVAQSGTKQQKQSQENVLPAETVVTSIVDCVNTADPSKSPRLTQPPTRQPAVRPTRPAAPPRQALSSSNPSAQQRRQPPPSSRPPYPKRQVQRHPAPSQAPPDPLRSLLQNPRNAIHPLHVTVASTCIPAPSPSLSPFHIQSQQPAAGQNAPPPPDVLYHGISLIHQMIDNYEKACMIHFEAAREEICRLANVVKSQERYIHQTATSQQNLVTGLNSRVATLEHELGVKDDAAVTLHAARLESEALLQKESAALRKVEDDRDELDSEVERLNAVTARLEARHATQLEEQREKLEKKLGSMLQEPAPVIRNLEAQIDTHVQTIKDLDDKATLLVDEAEKLKVELKEIKEKRDNLHSNVETLKNEHTAKTARLGIQYATELKDQKANLESKMKSMSTAHSSVIGQLKAEIETQAQTIRNLELEKEGSTKDYAKLEESMKSCEADLERLKLEHSQELEARQEKQTVAVRAVEKERGNLRLEMGKLEKGHAADVLLQREQAEALEDCRKKRAELVREVQCTRDKSTVEAGELRKDHAADVKHLRSEHAKQSEKLRNKVANLLQVVQQWREKLTLEVGKLGKEHAAEVERLKLDYTEELKEHRKKGEELLKGREELLAEVNKMTKERDDSVSKSKEQESAINLQLEFDARQKMVADLEQQMKTLNYEHEKVLTLSKLASDDLKLKDTRLEYLQKQLAQLIERHPPPAPSSSTPIVPRLAPRRKQKPRLPDPEDIIILDHEPEELVRLNNSSSSRSITRAPTKAPPLSPLAAGLASSVQRARLPSTNPSESQTSAPPGSSTSQQNSRKRKASNPHSEQAAQKNGRSDACMML
ncbi:hypothetical protein QFC22_000964 [Naganishia vaughanmartiniae]|uniref:Uncharacterized protein n=1 Tax=Naganishia vaughanmartiniae TaxID=1424756 RepID=A0ACC2XLM9_9TREE|nr:hypothetical protein QFC22_000964 [Naganishia vaughanmartiniae]